MYDETISVEEIVSYFKERDDLLGKPKLFFIQACRAGIQDDSTNVGYEKHLCPPESSDILVAYSAIARIKSFWDFFRGSWFIQTLIKQLHTHAHNAHLMDIMALVNKDLTESDLKSPGQVTKQVSTLTKFVYFKMASVAKIMQTA